MHHNSHVPSVQISAHPQHEPSALSSFIRSRPHRTARRPLRLTSEILCQFPSIIDRISGETLHIDSAGVVFQGRHRLYLPPDEAEVDAVLDILSSAKRVRSLTLCSYTAKTPIEKIIGRYLTNGSVILGAHRAGIRVGWIENTLNVRIAVSRVWFRGLGR